MDIRLATEPGADRQPNEDFAIASSDVLVMLDGVSSFGTPSGCVHGTPWYVRNLGAAILTALTDEPDADLAASLAAAITQVRGRHQGTCELDHPGTPASTVLILQVSGPRARFLVLADSVLLLDTTAGLRVLTDNREATVSAKLRAGIDTTTNGSAEHDAALARFMTQMQRHRNQPGGFWVAAADPDAAAAAITGQLPTTALRRAAVMTDGATRLVDRFGLLDWSGLLDILDDQGPAELIRRTRQAEASDPHGIRWKRGKTFDDATAAYCAAVTDPAHPATTTAASSALPH